MSDALDDFNSFYNTVAEYIKPVLASGIVLSSEEKTYFERKEAEIVELAKNNQEAEGHLRGVEEAYRLSQNIFLADRGEPLLTPAKIAEERKNKW